MKTLTEYISEQKYEDSYIVTKEVFNKLKKMHLFKFIGTKFIASGGKWIGQPVYVKGCNGAAKTLTVKNERTDFTTEIKLNDFWPLLYTPKGAPTKITFAQPTKID